MEKAVWFSFLRVFATSSKREEANWVTWKKCLKGESDWSWVGVGLLIIPLLKENKTQQNISKEQWVL